ncbi:MAG: hypothetical protein HXK19_03285, partial [Alloprevotella tannerae]|nr:hypothetical protein [Alloprevotella tannerae]
IVYSGVDFDADYEKMTQEVSAQDVQQLCKALLAQKRRIEVTMLPRLKRNNRVRPKTSAATFID